MSIRLPSGPGALTERNREVLRLLERGLTNFEIAQELGISLEGAKYHVREIMTRLNVESREEAVAAWKREQQPARRMRRAVLAMFAGKGGWASAAVVAMGLGMLTLVLALNLGGDESPPASPPEPEATATASPTAPDPSVTNTTAATVPSTPTAPVVVAAPPSATPTIDKYSITLVPTRTPIPVVTSAVVPITRLFEGPPDGAAPETIVREMGAPIPSPFEPLEEVRMVVYDVVTGDSIDLGPGWRGQFSPNGSWVGWIAEAPPAQLGEASAMNLASGEIRTFGEGFNVSFLGENRLVVSQQSADFVVYDLATGSVSASQELPGRSPSASGYYWDRTYDESTKYQFGGYGRSRFRLVDDQTHEVVLEFDAATAGHGAPGEIVLATAIDDASIDSEDAESNIFIVDIATGEAEFIARVRFSPWATIPLTATERYVLWTEAYCSWERQGRMHLFDRETRTITVIEDGQPDDAPSYDRYGRLTPDGDIALGEFGAKAIVDGETLEYRVVLPPLRTEWGNDVVWSPDYRYAFYEHRGGHGALCSR